MRAEWWRHWWSGHRWVVASVKPMLSQRLKNPMWGLGDGPLGSPTPVTLVLYRCSCGVVRTETLDGHWALADLRGEVPDG